MTAEAFKAARDFLMAHQHDYATAHRDFRWPALTHFNWALDWFDGELARGDSAQPSRPDHRRRRRRVADLRRTIGTFQPRRQRPARARRQTRRPRAADARQRRPVVGGDAGGDEARRGRHSRDDAADADRSRRPVRTRPRPLRRHLGRGNGEIRWVQHRSDPHRDRRRAGRLAQLRRPAGRAAGLHAGRPHVRDRSAAALFHLRHDLAPQAGGAQPSKLPGRPPDHDVLDRPASGRRASQHLLPGLGQARL